MIQEAGQDGVVRLKSQNELLKEEEQQRAAEKTMQAHRSLISKFASMNKLRIEIQMREGSRYCSLVDPDDGGKRKVVIPSMIEGDFINLMMQYIAQVRDQAVQNQQ